MITGRFFLLAAGLSGAAGVALSAIAAHRGGGNVQLAASFLLMHAPAFLAVGLLGAGRVLKVGAAVLLLGVMLFCGDLVLRDYTGQRLFAMAAPAGGMLMIAGWLAIAASAFARNGSAAK